MSPAVFFQNEEASNLIRQGRIQEAIDCYDRALALNPDNDVILNYKAIALITIGRFEDALVLAKRASSLNPDSADIWINMGVALEKLDRLPEARAALERAVSLNPYDAYGHALLGIIYQKLDHEDLAECQNRQLQELMFPNEYAGFFFGTAAFLLGMLLGGIRSVEGKPFEIIVLSQVIILFFFCSICFLYWRALKKQQEINRNIIVAPGSPPVEGDWSTRGMYGVLLLMIVVFGIGIFAGGDVWNWMQ